MFNTVNQIQSGAEDYDLGAVKFRPPARPDNPDNDDKSSSRWETPRPPEEPRSFGSRILPLILGAGAIYGAMRFCGREEPTLESKVAAFTATEEGRKDVATPDKGLSNLLSSVEEALNLVNQGKVEQVVYEFEISGSGSFDYAFKLKSDKPPAKDPFFGNAEPQKVLYLRGIQAGSERESLLTGLRSANSVVNSTLADERDVVIQGNPWSGVISTALFLGVAIWLISRMRRAMNSGGAGGILGDFTSHKGQVMRGGELSDRFSDLGGLDHILDELKDLKSDIDQIRKGGTTIKLPTGTLLCGPPGVGKTKIGRSLAGELECPFMYFDCSAQATELFVGSGAARIRDSFNAARALRDEETARLRSRPNATGSEEGVVIMFLDEFDSIGEKRRDISRLAGDSESAKVVNSLLNEMDGLNKERNKNIIVFAATNLAERLDDALMRPGRFTKQFDIPLPSTHQERLEILQKLHPLVVKKQGFEVENEASLAYVARITPGKSGDHLRQILQEACDIARRDSRTKLTEPDLFEASQRLDSGRIRKGHLSAQRHELVGVHEHGHGVAALACGVEVFLISMLPRGNSLGRVIPNPEMLETLANKRELLSRVLIGAGGRAAELATYGPSGITPGASSDLEQMRAIIKNMIATGMLNDHYALSLARTPEHELREEHIALIDSIASGAVGCAEKLVQSVGEERMAALVKESIAAKRELVGKDAQEFYEKRLPPELVADLRRIAAEFLNDPCGEHKLSSLKPAA